jgi:hypothetical protein
MGFLFSKPNVETLLSYALEPSTSQLSHHTTLDKFEEYMKKVSPLIPETDETFQEEFLKIKKKTKFNENLFLE